MSKIFDSIKVYGSGTTNSSSTLDTYDSSGTTTFTIKDGGNVGIGTSSPTEKLFVSGKTYISESLGVGSSAPGSGISLGSTYPIYFGNTNHNIYNSGDSLFVNGWSYLTLNASTAVGISTNNINRLYVNSIGNVGIGTSSPSEKLEVNGDIKITSQSNVLKIGSYSALSITQGAGAANVIVGHNNTMNDGGNGGGVVIGASSTSTNNGIAIGLFSTVSLGTDDGIAIGRDTSISNSSIRGVAIGRQATVTANNAFAIGNYTTANQNDTIILGNNSSGVKPNVGIGTSTPLTTLHVNGKATIQGDVDVFGNVNVIGTATTLNTETVQTRDNKILLNYSGTNVTAVGGGISVLSANTIYTSGLTELITDINGDWNSNVGLNITGRTSDNSSNGLRVVNFTGDTLFNVQNDGSVSIGNPNLYAGGSIYFDNSDKFNTKLYINGNYDQGNNNHDLDIVSRYTKWGTNSGSGFGVITEYVGLDVYDGFSSFKINKQQYNSYEAYTTLGVAFREGSGVLQSSNIGSFIFNRTINNDDIYDRTLNGLKIDTSLGSWTNTTGTSTNIGLNVTVGNADVSYAAIFNGGNVGIGTSTPSEKLEVSNGYIKTNQGVIVDGGTYNGIRFNSSGFSRLAIDNSYKLNATFIEGFKFTNGVYDFFNYDQSGFGDTFQIGNGLIKGRTTGTTDIYLGINVSGTPSSTLHVVGTDSSPSKYGLKVQDSGGTDNFVVRNDGNVGIGTSNLNAKLDVRGTTSSGEVLLQLYSTDWATPSERPRFTLTQGTSLIRANYQNFYASDDNGNVNVTFRGDNAIIEMYSPSFSATTFRITNSNKPLIYAPNSGLIGTTSKWLFDPNNSTNPTANVHIKGIDSSSSNYGLKVQDSGGTDNLVVRNDGNVGIGTSNPITKFMVDAGSSPSQYMYIKSTGVDCGVIIDSGEYPAFVMRSSGLTSFAMQGVGQNTMIFRPTSSIEWRAGDTNTSMYGSVNMENATNSYSYFRHKVAFDSTGIIPSAIVHIKGSDTSSSNYGLKVQNSGGTDNLVVRNDGNIGIGTASPSTKLHISGTTEEILKVESSNAASGVISVYNQNISALNLRSSTDTTMSIWGYHGVGGVIKSKGSLLFRNYTNNTQYAQVDNIDSNPSWGFGNQSGSGSPSSDTRIRIVGQDSSSSNYGLKVQNSGGTNNLVVRNDGYVQTAGLLKLLSSGLYPSLTFENSVGHIGKIEMYNNELYFTTSGQQTVLNSTGLSLGTNAGATSKLQVRGIDATASNFALKVENSASTPLFYVRNDGNVGIGTASPSEKLDVSGKTKTTTLQVTSGSPQVGYVLTATDTNGNMSWDSLVDSFYVEPSSTAVTWNVSGNSSNYKLTLTANTTLNLNNVRNGDYGTIILTQDSGGNRTVTLGTVNGAAATHKVVNGGAGLVSLTATANAIDILSFTYDGTNMYWNKGLNYT